MRKTSISFAAALLCLTLGALAQNPSKEKSRMNQQDKDFARLAAQANRGEIEIGTLAQQKASNDAVKEFGKRMVEDHTNAGHELRNWSAQTNFKLPTGITADDSSTKSSLSSESGTQFDQKYMQSQLKDHKQVIAAFEKEIQDGQDPQLKQIAAKILPVLQDHVRLAEDVAGKLGMSGKMGLTDESKAISGSSNPK